MIHFFLRTEAHNVAFHRVKGPIIDDVFSYLKSLKYVVSLFQEEACSTYIKCADSSLEMRKIQVVVLGTELLSLSVW